MFVAIVPAYNEEERIGSVVRSLFHHVDAVLVVDDASRDRTAACAEEAGATVLSHIINRGQGAAIETGHAYARSIDADYVLHFDGDGQFDPSDITPALAAFQKNNADILFGSRFLGVHSNVPWIKRRILLPLARFFHQLFFRVRLTDAHNGFRILSKKALGTMVIRQDRMAHASEIPILAKKHGLRVLEYPVKITYHEYGQGGLGSVHIMRDLFFGRFIK